MLFQFTDTERGWLEELLYELRRTGYVVDLHYDRANASVSASRQIRGKLSDVQVVFRRYGRKLQVVGRIQTPEGELLQLTRIVPIITYVKASVKGLGESE